MSNRNTPTELTKKKYNETICFMWEKQTGNLMSMEIDDIMFDKLQHAKKGDKLMIKRMAAKKHATSPDAALEIIDAASVAKYRADQAARAAGNTSDDGRTQGRNPSYASDEDVAF